MSAAKVLHRVDAAEVRVLMSEPGPSFDRQQYCHEQCNVIVRKYKSAIPKHLEAEAKVVHIRIIRG